MRMRRARYAKLIDNIITHPKFIGLDPTAGWLWTLSLAYCHAQLTDGLVPTVMPARLLGMAPRRAGAVAAELVTAGLWEPVSDGWRVHDYLEWNESKAEVLADNARHVDRQQRYRDASQVPSRDASLTRQKSGENRTEQNRTERRSTTDPRYTPPPVDSGGQSARPRDPAVSERSALAREETGAGGPVNQTADDDTAALAILAGAMGITVEEARSRQAQARR